MGDNNNLLQTNTLPNQDTPIASASLHQSTQSQHAHHHHHHPPGTESEEQRLAMLREFAEAKELETVNNVMRLKDGEMGDPKTL
jgi:hypothetical protein